MKTTLLLSSAAALVGASSAQITYELTPLNTVPGASSTVATGLNDRGEVVGWSQFFGANPGIRAWHWTEATGFTLLPPAPGQNNTRAIDINIGGVIAGDGAYDSGFSWSYQNGAYTILGALPGDGRSVTGQLNEAGEVTGTSWAFQFAIPKKATFSAPGSPLVEIEQGEGIAINELGQVAGWVGTFAPMRWSEAVGLELLPLVPGKAYHYAADINNHGAIVGRATQANGNGSVPYLYTDANGPQQIGNFGGGASAAGINDHGTVIGNHSASGGNPWTWDSANGVRFLQDHVDLGLGYTPTSALRINARGEILARAFSSAVAGYVPVLLTPLAPEQPGLGFCFGDTCPCGEDRLAGCPNTTGVGASLAGSGSASLAAGDLALHADGMPANTFGLVFAGTTRVDVGLGDGRRCIDGALVRFPVRSAVGGAFDEGPGIPAHLAAMAGDTFAFQAWYRDVGGCTGAGYNLTNAYEVTFVP